MINIISVVIGRRLMASPRLLSAGTVIVDYRLVIPADVAAEIKFTADSMLESQDAIQVSINASLGVVTAERITISSVIALNTSLRVTSSEENFSANTTNLLGGNALLESSSAVVPTQTGAASAGILTGVVGGLLLVTVIAVLIFRRRCFRKYPKIVEGSALARSKEGEPDLEQGGRESGMHVDEVAASEAGADEIVGSEDGPVPTLQAELSEVVMSVVEDVAEAKPLQTAEVDGHSKECAERPAGSSIPAEVLALPDDDAPFVPSSISGEPLATWRGFFQHADVEDKMATDAALRPRDGESCDPQDPCKAC